MATLSLKEQIISELDHLTPAQQARLLEVARNLQKSSLPTGTPCEVLVAAMDRFELVPGAIDDMMCSIEEGCENINWAGWE